MNKKLLYFILFFVVALITILGCISNAKTDGGASESKEETEIGYIENKLTTLLNSINNITFENYNISINQINGQTAANSQKMESQSSNQNEQRGSAQDVGSSEGEGGTGSENGGSSKSAQAEGDSSQGSSSTSNNNKSQAMQYKFERVGILTKNDTIDWQTIKNEIELMYSILPTVTLDLYQKNVSQEDILSFNKEVDKLTESVKIEDKQATLSALANLYSYLPKFSRTVSNEKKSLIIETKSNIFYAYSLLETDDWNKIKEYVQKAINVYSRILNNISDNENNNSVNKCYILLNELSNAVDIQNKDIFLIKYKNLLEEINIL